MKRRDLVRYLEQSGCVLKHDLINPARKTVSAVPRHTEVKGPTALKICRDLEIPAPASVN